MAKVLVIGSGGREHAIAYKFKQSNHVDEVFVAPGNAGMSDVATIVDIDSLDFERLISFVKENTIDLTFVGGEIPLCNGIVDAFQQANCRIFGPSKAAAELEGSKVFSKNLMKKYNIPTATYETFNDPIEAKNYLKKQSMPIVIKADGLAYGKGVLICETLDDGLQAIDEIMTQKCFKDAGNDIVIEEFLEGEEFSLLAFVNGELVVPMQIAQDHKRAFDNDEGLNTGGMGAYTPVNHLGVEAIQEATEKVMQAMATAMVLEGKPFVGILYGGCMVTKNGVKTIEYNVRFGDPESEVILLAMNNDLYEVVNNTLEGKKSDLLWSDKSYCGVVIASNGYPLDYVKNNPIYHLDKVECPVFHMSTALKDGQLVNSGGRVLFVVGSGNSIAEARNQVYKEIDKIQCDGCFYRKDIAVRGL